MHCALSEYSAPQSHLAFLEAALKHKKKEHPLTPFTQTHLFDEGYRDHVPGDNTMVHELQEGSQGESQHFTVTEKMKNAVRRDLVAMTKPVQAE